MQEDITAAFVGEMGVKAIIVGEETVYTRQGGYFFLELSTEEAAT